MNRRVASMLAAATLIGSGMATVGPAAATDVSGGRPPLHAGTIAVASHRATATARTVTLVAPKDMTEGDRFVVVARITAPRKARTIQWQALLPAYLGDPTPKWTVVKTTRVNGNPKRTYKALAGLSETQRYRAVVTYVDSRPVRSRAISVRVWHWTDLTTYQAYYKVGTVYDNPYFSFPMNGDTWTGWRTTSSMAESRYTLGRNCKAFRGTLGVDDYTDDGGTAQITLLTEETNVVYTSPTLVPGQVVAVQFDLDSPYRFGIQGRNTTPDDGIARDVSPAIGAAQFLCHVG